MSGDDDEDGERWGRAVEGMLRDREAAFRRAMEVRALLATRKTWAAAVAGLLAELHELRGAPSAQARPKPIRPSVKVCVRRREPLGPASARWGWLGTISTSGRS
jgi:hypothetical protein